MIKSHLSKLQVSNLQERSANEIKALRQSLRKQPQDLSLVVKKEVDNIELEDDHTDDTIEYVKQKVDFSQLKPGHYLFDIQYYKVVEVKPNSIAVVNERGFGSEIDRDIIEEGMYSANQYEIEKAVSRTEICEILEQAGNYIFTVNFNRKVREKDLKDKLLNSIVDQQGNLLSHSEIEAALKKISHEAVQGDQRTLVGHLLRVEPKMGRSTVIDLKIPLERNRVRLVDHRTINWLILKNVKYVVK